ncbi:MAG TPA: gluconate 2-dehydrogenase subunit 3 family protein [Bryobacteraceae bacterium]|nr:gluconate 2-dehydrogenase subunit 3 family protein [Bryobacteraceae bacterium]
MSDEGGTGFSLCSRDAFSRREMLRAAALAVLASGTLPLADAQEVHRIAEIEGLYRPKALTPHEYRTLAALADLIVPADEVSLGAVAAGAPAWIDLLASQSPELTDIYTGGIAWLDITMRRRAGSDFVSAKPDQQTALLDLIAYRKNGTGELAPGVRFFEWARKMVVDGFYSSPLGTKDLGYMGNTAVSKFEVPQEAIDYALRRSPFGK